MDDEYQVWPPAPNVPVSEGESQPSKGKIKRCAHFISILVMWAATFGQVLLQMFFGVNFLTMLLGFLAVGLALFLATRQEKRENAARINGGLRLVLWVAGFLFILLPHIVNLHLTFGKHP